MLNVLYYFCSAPSGLLIYGSFHLKIWRLFLALLIEKAQGIWINNFIDNNFELFKSFQNEYDRLPLVVWVERKS